MQANTPMLQHSLYAKTLLYACVYVPCSYRTYCGLLDYGTYTHSIHMRITKFLHSDYYRSSTVMISDYYYSGRIDAYH